MRVIKTKTIASIKDEKALYHLIRTVALYYRAIMDEDEAVARTIAGRILPAMIEAKPVLGVKQIGIPNDVINNYVKQVKGWAENRINWDSAIAEKRFDTAVEEFFLYLYEILFETEEADLSPRQLELIANFDEDEANLLHSMLGFCLNLGRKYGTARAIESVLTINASVFSEDVEFYANYIDTLEQDGYELPADYEITVTKVRDMLKQHKITTVEGDDLMPTHEGDRRFATENPEQYAQYLNYRKFLRYNAFRAIVANLIYDNAGTPTAWNTVFRQVTTREGVYIPSDIFPNERWTGSTEAVRTETSAGYAISHRSPFGEALKQFPVGNVQMNPSYTRGSVEFVARYKVPNSKAMTTNYVYTLDATKKKNLARFDQMRDILKNLNTYRGRWLKDLKKLDVSITKYNKAYLDNEVGGKKRKITPPSTMDWRNGILAMLCEIGYQASPRTGEKGTSSLDKGSNQRISTHALTTLKLGHLVVDPDTAHPVNIALSEGAMSLGEMIPNRIAFKYTGKAAEPQLHTFTDTPSDGDTVSRKLLMSVLRSYLSLIGAGYKSDQQDVLVRSRSDLLRESLFKIPNRRLSDNPNISTWIDVINRHVNDYLSRKIQLPATFKVFRKLKATTIFAQHMDSVKSQLDDSNIEIHIRQAAALAGDALGHAAGKRATGTMALQYYIDAMTLKSYYDELGLVPSTKIANLIKDNIQDEKS